jgi:membrane-bound serine protease (ClpP class)
VIRWDGPIGPVAARYLEREISAADREHAVLLVIGLDTPGGLDVSMRTIVRAIHESPVPIAVWVGPSGSRAASAGCVIGLAAPILAMAPGTNIGAAHPVSIGGGTPNSTMAEKVENDAAAYVESLARERGRNVEWARDSVRKSLSASAEEAVRLGIADFLAADIPALLTAANGRTVRVRSDDRIIDTAGARVVTIDRDWRTGILATLNDPNVAYILLLLGIYGLFFELANPGALFPGIFGVVSLILGLYSLANLPVNWAGLLLLLAGAIMLLLEVKIVSHGLLAVGGIVSLVLGSLLLFESPVPAFRLSLGVIIPAVAITAAFFLWLVGKGVAAQRRPPVTGLSALLGRRGEVRVRLAPLGTVMLEGTHWSARAEGGEPIEVDRTVRVVGVDGLLLKVRPED